MAKESAKTKEKSPHITLKSDKHSEVIINERVLVTMAGIAALESGGVCSLSDNITRDTISKHGMRNLSKGVRVTRNDDGVSVHLSINIEFGNSIPAVVANVQDRVRGVIEGATGFNVTDVNVRIASVVVK